MSSGNARQQAELRDQAARTRLAYNADIDQMRERLRVADAPTDADWFTLVGHIAECVTALEAVAADADDTVLSQAVSGLRSQTTRVGNVLARRRATYREGGDA